MFYPDAALITLRESLEAFVIIAVFVGVVVKLGEPAARRYLFAGAGAAVVVAVLAALGIDRLARDLYESSGSAALFEGVASLVAVGVLTYMIVWMRQHTHRLVDTLRSDVTRAVRAGRPLVLFSIAFVAVIREGLETALFLGAMAPGRTASGLAVSAAAGFLVSAVVAYLLFRGVIRLNWGQFFGVTGAMLVFFAAGLLATAVHELTEFGWLPETRVAWSTAALLAQGSAVGALFKAVLGYRDTPTMLEATVWLLYLSLLGAWFLAGLRPHGQAAAAPAGEQ